MSQTTEDTSVPAITPAAPSTDATPASTDAPPPPPATVPAPAEKKPEPTVPVSGVIDIDTGKGGNGQLLDLARYGKRRPTDAFVPKELIRRFKIRQGSFVTGTAQPPEGRFPNPKMKFIESVDGLTIEERRAKIEFTQLTTISPDQQLKMETKDGRLTTRAVDLFCPVGKGTRGLIVAPPRTGKTTLLRDMALGVLENHPECHVMILLVDERPEEVTDFKRSVPAEVWASSNDENVESHIRIADLCIERARRLVEAGKDVVLFLDSLTRLARAHNTQRNSGRTGSGGLDVRALEKPRQLFASARNTEDGGSLTIVASILIETGSRMDDVIFQEFKGTGNMELVLDRKCAEMRLWPAMNVASSGTRKEELLISADKLDGIHFFRRALVSQRIEEATETMIARLSKTKTNEEFLKLIAR
ncbi:transcription termination factor Rho [Geminisphaera colitermitum]|uniref:transcription termination factor Rho n=1 Tax=Geminisphaera colitermitum TaxID=1148786 RepID=UPI0001964E23|nr:transcription termination factor Rho [Geminisphaera colitermitum]